MPTPTSETLNGGTSLPTRTPVGSPADGVSVTKDAGNVGSRQPDAVTGQSGAANTSSVTSGMTCTPTVPVVIPAIQRGKDTLPRNVSNAADASVSRIANAGGPRDGMTQAPLSGKQAPTSAPERFLGADSTDQN